MNQLAALLQKHFATNQNYFLEQQPDGSYRKRSGEVTFKRLANMLDQRKSIAVLQRNIDLSVNWICFDFDILKDLLSSELLPNAESALRECVYEFWRYLEQCSISCIVEFSGNRGFHIWITFDDPLKYWSAYDLQQKILKNSGVEFDRELIALDLFPRSRSPSGGIGSGVKIPMSLHTKSQAYSRLIACPEDLLKDLRCTNLDEKVVEESVSILGAHQGLSISQVETILDRLVGDDEGGDSEIQRISLIKIAVGFSLNTLLEHWKKSPVFSVLAIKIEKCEKLKNDERKLLVGLLARVGSTESFSYVEMLQEIFSRMRNYDASKTQTAIASLSGFLFPSRAQIESVLGLSFPDGASDLDIVKSCIPYYLSHYQNDFRILEKDIEVARVAESNYVRTNDEVQVRKVVNTLSLTNATKNLQHEVEKLLLHPDKVALYLHNRNEPKKIRKLITLGAAERVATSAAMKQIIHHFGLKPSSNSYGYCVNRGFKGGHIFEPWLSRWVNFISNIGVAIEEKSYSDFYIVKSDIRSFYDDIPHDGVKRLLLEGVDQEMRTKINGLSQDALEDYKKIVNLFFGIALSVNQKPIGLPQGPAYARWLAELYIFSLDQYFDSLIKSESVYFYQRFVDDIFFIVPDEVAASNLLQQVRQHLAVLGLQVNDEKTIVRKISDFTPDFDRYKSQSKYVVDKISRKFDDASEGEKDNAIEEFLRLTQADTYVEDLSFIYSHLTTVESLNSWKREHLLPVIRSGEGRGSLYR
ncbi:MAG: RNA-directed DNA polymerase, partial [Chryseobacterium sp.]